MIIQPVEARGFRLMLLQYSTWSMSSQSSLPTKIISLGRRWRVPPLLTRNQEVRLISASLAHLWPLMHPAENKKSVRLQLSGARLLMKPFVSRVLNSENDNNVYRLNDAAAAYVGSTNYFSISTCAFLLYAQLLFTWSPEDTDVHTTPCRKANMREKLLFYCSLSENI